MGLSDMKKLMNAALRLVRDDEGSQATEIALGIVLIALTAGLGMVFLGNELAQFFSDMAQSVKDASPGSIPAPTAPTAPS
jgi:Flp pilus assembly pilin Flp